MFKRVRPVIIVIENTKDVVFFGEDIFKNINKGYFGEDYEIIVDTFQLLTDGANKEPNFVYYKDFQMFPTVETITEKKVDLDSLFEYLLKFEFLNDKKKYVQPIVLFALDGSNEYIFDEDRYLMFTHSYIYTDSMRPVHLENDPYLKCKRNKQVVDYLSNKDSDEKKTFLALGTYNALSYAFWLMETMPEGETDVIVRPPFPKDIVIKKGKICRVRTKSPKKIAKWKKELRYYRRF